MCIINKYKYYVDKDCISRLVCMHACLVTQLCPTHGLQLAGYLCPWDFPGKNIGGGFHFLLWGIFLTQELNL